MVYFLMTDGFEEIEAITPIDFLRRCGANVKTVAVGDSKRVVGAHNIPIEADINFDEIDKKDLQMLVLPGGPGHIGLKCEKVYALIGYAAENNIPIGAICAAPSIIGELGMLDGKRVTCFPGYEKMLKGAVICGDPAVHDGQFITACGAGAAGEFAFLLAEELFGRQKSEEIKSAMQFR